MANPHIIEEFLVDPANHVKGIRTRASANWYVQFNVSGSGPNRQRRRSLKTANKHLAMSRAHKILQQIMAGDIGASTRNRNKATIGEVMLLYTEHLRGRGRAASTLRNYQIIFNKLAAFVPRGERMPVIGLTVATLDGFETALRTTGVAAPRRGKHLGKMIPALPLSPKTVAESMKFVAALVEFAHERGHVERNPAEKYSPPKARSQEIETFSAEELRLIFADPDPQLAGIWRFFLETCLRIGELCFLQKADIVADAGQPVAIWIREKICPKTRQVLWKPKHGRNRLVPLTADAAKILAKELANSTTAWTFQAPQTTSTALPQWKPGRLQGLLAKRLQAAGIDHGHPHVFRHTGATFLANLKGMPVPVLMKFLGHSQISTTMRYLHVKPRDVADIMQSMDFNTVLGLSVEAGAGSSTSEIVAAVASSTATLMSNDENNRAPMPQPVLAGSS